MAPIGPYSLRPAMNPGKVTVALTLQWGSATNTGLLRSNNQDAVLAAAPVFVVADGLGGHAAGEVASRLAVEAFAPLAYKSDLTRADVVRAVADAHARILAHAEADPASAHMGTTVSGVAVVWFGDSMHWLAFNVGDSRVYRVEPDRLVQVTVDHSEVQQLIDAGHLAAEDAETHPRRNVVTRALGISRDATPDCWIFPAVAGERLLLCTDGLTKELRDHEILAALEGATAPTGAEQLVAAALDHGGRDNVTVVVVDALPTAEAPQGTSEVDDRTGPPVSARPS